MQAFVLDVSACRPWCFEDEQSAFADRLPDFAASGSHLHVPSIWPLEILNALVQGVRRQRLSAKHAVEFLEQLNSLSFRVDAAHALTQMPRLMELANRHRLTSYDAAYLELALRTGLPLATMDDALRRAAIAEQVTLVGA